MAELHLHRRAQLTCRKHKAIAEAAPSVEAALGRIRQLALRPVRILICGSLYLAGHVLALQDGTTVQSN